jgi:hypothetical protein
LSVLDVTISTMTELRPALTGDLSGSELQRWYWLRSELAGFARSIGVRASGSKLELIARLAAHLDGDPLPTTRARRLRPMQALLPEPITAATPLPAGQRCTQQLRRYFTTVIGPSFRFDAAMRAFLGGGTGTTVGAAVDHWYRTRSQPRAEIGAQFELNTFMRMWHHDHPAGSRIQALDAWKVHRSLPAEARCTQP